MKQINWEEIHTTFLSADKEDKREAGSQKQVAEKAGTRCKLLNISTYN